jgi:hypothetical protein
LIRSKKFAIHQGVNRIVWDMRRDGVRPMPGPEAAKLDDGLPSGIEILAGEYKVTLSLAREGSEPANTEQIVNVLPDPRSQVSTQARLENYQALLDLEQMQANAVAVVERIVHAQADIATAQTLIKQRQLPGESPNEALKTLAEQAGELHKSLVALENRVRVPPGTRGFVYDDDKAISKIGLAKSFVSSSMDAPTESAHQYMGLAHQSLDDASQAVDQFMKGELADFRASLAESDIGLFTRSIEPDQG